MGEIRPVGPLVFAETVGPECFTANEINRPRSRPMWIIGGIRILYLPRDGYRRAAVSEVILSGRFLLNGRFRVWILTDPLSALYR